MQRINLIYLVAGMLIAGSISLAIAEPFSGSGSRSGNMARPDMPMMMGGFRGPGMMAHDGAWRHDPAHAAIADLFGLERIYVLNGRVKELGALYQHVLDKTQNPEVRRYVYRHLARSEMKPTNVNQAIATLQKGLDEDMARLESGVKN